MLKQSAIIAIDGPAGAGKTTLSRDLARSLQYIYVDSGAMYRALALKVCRLNINDDDEAAIAEILDSTKIEFEYSAKQKVLLDGEEVTDAIRKPDISTLASKISAYEPVRKHMVDAQRNLAKGQKVVMDGRDIGTYVFPEADVKIFLYSTVEVRAKRRHADLEMRGIFMDIEEVKKDIKARDKKDSSRTIAPLMVSKDATIVDTTELSYDDSLFVLKQVVGEKLSALM